MTDSELASAIAEAVRPVWADLRIVCGDCSLLCILDGQAWQVQRVDHHSSMVPPRWAAAILLHELERIERIRPATRESVMAGNAASHLRGIIRAQS